MAKLTAKQENARLLKMASKKPTKFIVMTFIGLGMFIGGIVMAALGGAFMALYGDKMIALIIIGVLIIIPGLVLFLVGLPSWITTNARYKSANHKLGKY